MEIYLDNSATTRPCPEAVRACVRAMEREYGNPSSLHGKGLEAERVLNGAKGRLAEALACGPGEILFTSGATEANNLALFGAAGARRRRGKTILTTAVEHPSVLEAAAELERRGFTVKRLPPVEGRYTPGQFAEEVDGDTILVSCMLVNNETGLLLPVKEIAEAVKRKKPDALVHCDAVQGFLKEPLRLKETEIDLLSVSGHKVFAPKGIGALYVRKGTRLLPLLYGGGQQNGLRPGTEPVPLAAAFGAAVEAQAGKLAEARAHYGARRAHLLARLAGMEGVEILSEPDAAPHIVCLTAGGVRSETMLHFLEEREIYVSSGSACKKGKQSHVLAALGIGRELADSALRVSFSPETTDEMLDLFAARLEEGLAALARPRGRRG